MNLTQDQVRDSQKKCPRCGAPMIEVLKRSDLIQLVCRSLVTFGRHQ